MQHLPVSLTFFTHSRLVQPLAPANGAAPDATRDPLLKDKVHGDQIMNMRKALAFAGFTHRSPRKMDYTRIDAVYPGTSTTAAKVGSRDPSRDGVRRTGTLGRSRALSL